MAEMITLRDALLDEVKDLYSAEKQLVKTLPKLAKHATSEELRDAITEHFGQTRQHVARLEQVFDLLDERARAKTCAGMQGIIEEGFGDARAGRLGSGRRCAHHRVRPARRALRDRRLRDDRDMGRGPGAVRRRGPAARDTG